MFPSFFISNKGVLEEADDDSAFLGQSIQAVTKNHFSSWKIESNLRLNNQTAWWLMHLISIILRFTEIIWTHFFWGPIFILNVTSSVIKELFKQMLQESLNTNTSISPKMFNHFLKIKSTWGYVLSSRDQRRKRNELVLWVEALGIEKWNKETRHKNRRSWDWVGFCPLMEGQTGDPAPEPRV